MKIIKVIVLILAVVQALIGMVRAQDDWMEGLLDRVAVLSFEEKFDEAIRLLESSLETAKQRYGEAHQNYGDLTKALAILYLDTERYAKSEHYFQVTLEAYRKALGPDEYEVAEGYIDLAGVYEMQEKWILAESHLTQGLQVLMKNLDSEDPYLGEIRNWLSEIRALLGADRTSKPVEGGEFEKIDIPEKKTKTQGGKEISPHPKSDTTCSDIFEIIEVSCPKTVIFDRERRIVRYPVLKVTYRIKKTKIQVNWDERVEVITPDGKILEAGGEQQWYHPSRHQENRAYTVKGRCSPTTPGTYTFRLWLEGKGIKKQMVERSFEMN